MDDKVFLILEQLAAKMDMGFNDVKSDINEVKNRLTKLELKIENDITPKLDVLFEGQQQHTEILQRIENEVARHEEVILKRIK